jgi:integrase
MKLTLARINSAKIPPGKAELKLWDGAINGLFLRLLPGGGKSWVYRYRSGGGGRSAKIRSIKLGSFPALSIDAARDVARAHAGQVAKGHDPAEVRHEQRRREKATLGTLLAVDGPYERDLITRHIVQHKQVLSSLRRGLRRHMSIDIARLSRRDLVEALDALKDLPGARAELRKHTRVLLEWAVNGGLVQANVLAGMRSVPKTRAQRLAEASKRRALTDPDIIAVWRAAEYSGRFGSLVQLGLLTAMRRNELATLRWSNIHSDRIVLLPEVTKTSAKHEIPLTDLMRRILKRQPRTTSPLVFPSDQTGGPMSAWNRFKMQLMHDADVGAWTLHDLRRTCRSLMTRIGIAEPVAELAIGHAKASLVGLYDLEKQWAARVDAFERVSNHIERLVGK